MYVEHFLHNFYIKICYIDLFCISLIKKICNLKEINICNELFFYTEGSRKAQKLTREIYIWHLI